MLVIARGEKRESLGLVVIQGIDPSLHAINENTLFPGNDPGKSALYEKFQHKSMSYRLHVCCSWDGPMGLSLVNAIIISLATKSVNSSLESMLHGQSILC